MKGKTQGSPVVVTHSSGILFLMAAIVGLLNSRGKKARASNTILARVAVCLLAGLREQTEDPAYEEGVLEVPLVVGFPVLGHAPLPPYTKISSAERHGPCFQRWNVWKISCPSQWTRPYHAHSLTQFGIVLCIIVWPMKYCRSSVMHRFQILQRCNLNRMYGHNFPLLCFWPRLMHLYRNGINWMDWSNFISQLE